MNYTTPGHVEDLLIKVHPTDYKKVREMVDRIFQDERIDVYTIRKYTFTICHNRRRLWVAGGYNATYAWGAPGHDFNEFLATINKEYLTEKLGINEVYDKRKSFANLRRAIRERLPWYKNPEAIKKVNELIREIENYGHSWEDAMYRIEAERQYIKLLWDADNDFKETLFGIFVEAYDFYETKVPDEAKVLWREFAQLQKKLKNKLAQPGGGGD